MKQILVIILTILTVLVMISEATRALFTNTAQNKGNVFGTGTLILTINNSSGDTSTPVFIVNEAAPGDSENQVLTLKNTGSINASSLIMTGVDVVDNVTDTSANLGDVLTTYLWEDSDNDNNVDVGEPTWVNGVHLTSIPNNVNLGQLRAGETRNFKIKLVFDVDAGNEYQGEGISFNFNFQARQ